MSSHRAAILYTGSEAPRAMVVSIEAASIAFVCQRIDGTWEPLYSARRTRDGRIIRTGLPGCFVLSDLALAALDRALERSRSDG